MTLCHFLPCTFYNPEYQNALNMVFNMGEAVTLDPS